MQGPDRFERIQRHLAERRTRRAALVAGAVTAAAVGATRLGGTLAQEASPSPEETTEKPMTMMVQAFEGGTWAPNGDGTFTLTLSGGLASTIYFSDRPERVFGSVPTPQFLDILGFTPENPPNAAVVVNDNGVEDIVVVELLDPVYQAGTLTYTVRVLDAYDEEGLGNAQQRKPGDNDLPAQFGEGALFIDDCRQGTITCLDDAGNQATIPLDCAFTYPGGCLAKPGDTKSRCKAVLADVTHWKMACP